MHRESFRKDGKKRIDCPNCRAYLTTRYLGQTERVWTCKNCKKNWRIPAHKVQLIDGRKVVYFGPERDGFSSTFTALDRKELSTVALANENDNDKIELEEFDDFELG